MEVDSGSLAFNGTGFFLPIAGRDVNSRMRPRRRRGRSSGQEAKGASVERPTSADGKADAPCLSIGTFPTSTTPSSSRRSNCISAMDSPCTEVSPQLEQLLASLSPEEAAMVAAIVSEVADVCKASGQAGPAAPAPHTAAAAAATAAAAVPLRLPMTSCADPCLPSPQQVSHRCSITRPTSFNAAQQLAPIGTRPAGSGGLAFASAGRPLACCNAPATGVAPPTTTEALMAALLGTSNGMNGGNWQGNGAPLSYNNIGAGSSGAAAVEVPAAAGELSLLLVPSASGAYPAEGFPQQQWAPPSQPTMELLAMAGSCSAANLDSLGELETASAFRYGGSGFGSSSGPLPYMDQGLELLSSLNSPLAATASMGSDASSGSCLHQPQHLAAAQGACFNPMVAAAPLSSGPRQAALLAPLAPGQQSSGMWVPYTDVRAGLASSSSAMAAALLGGQEVRVGHQQGLKSLWG